MKIQDYHVVHRKSGYKNHIRFQYMDKPICGTKFCSKQIFEDNDSSALVDNDWVCYYSFICKNCLRVLPKKIQKEMKQYYIVKKLQGKVL